MTDTYLRFEKTRELPDETIPCAKLITADRITGSHEMSKPGGDSQKFYAFFFSAVLPRRINTITLFPVDAITLVSSK